MISQLDKFLDSIIGIVPFPRNSRFLSAYLCHETPEHGRNDFPSEASVYKAQYPLSFTPYYIFLPKFAGSGSVLHPSTVLHHRNCEKADIKVQ